MAIYIPLNVNSKEGTYTALGSKIEFRFQRGYDGVSFGKKETIMDRDKEFEVFFGEKTWVNGALGEAAS